MPIKFVDGGDITLSESLKFKSKGSRSPHPGGGNNMTTLLMQLGVPTVLFWEVKAGLSGYEVTRLADRTVSHDDNLCGPWAQFDTKLRDQALMDLIPQLADEFSIYQTPYQLHIALAKKAFPGVTESSASFYLRHKSIIEPILHELAESRFAGHFSKRVYPKGELVTSRNFAGNAVVYEDGSELSKYKLADGYLQLLAAVQESELNPQVNIRDLGLSGVLPDARIMSVLDTAIFASVAGTTKVYAWSGVAMFQYILGTADSQRWREITSQMYDLVRYRALSGLPPEVEFVLIPTQGLGQLAVADEADADAINSQLVVLQTPKEFTASYLAEQFRQICTGMPQAQAFEFLSQKIPDASHVRLRTMTDQGNIAGACGVVAHQIQEAWRKQNIDAITSARKDLVRSLQNGDGKFILHKQPTITPLEILQGKRLFLLQGVLETPTGKLEALRMKYQQMVEGKGGKNEAVSFNPYSHAGWDW